MSKGTKRNALGRGLGALLTDEGIASAENEAHERPLRQRSPGVGSVADIQLDQIEINPFQPREGFDQEALQELADSIDVQGIIQPITVRKLNNNTFQVISGERRFRAAKLAGLEKIPTYIRTANDQQMLEMALIENIQREDLNAIEIAISYQRLISECRLKQEELGERVGKERSTVTNYLRLLKLPPDIQAAVKGGDISMGHARALINIEDHTLQLTLLKKILKEQLSVRKTEEQVKLLLSAKSKKNSQENYKEDEDMLKMQHKLSSHFGTKIKIISKDQEKGEIKIPFTSVKELNRILEIIDV